jgi:ribosomal protein L30/L7E
MRIKQYLHYAMKFSGQQSATQINKILNKLRLYQRYMGVFLKVTPQLITWIKEVEPYITYGYCLLLTNF